jgi:PAS domain S-box-containing protein
MTEPLPPSAGEIIESLLDFAPLVAYRVDLTHRRALYISPNVRQVLGYAAEELIGAEGRWEAITHPDDRHADMAMLEREIAEHTAKHERIRRIRDRSGKYRWFRSISRIDVDPIDRITLATGVLIDITQQVEAETALRGSEAHHRSLIENGSDIILVLNAEGVVRYVSPSVERILGWTPAERIGKSPFDLVHPDDFPVLFEIFQEGSGIPGASRTIEARVRHCDGSWRILEVTGRNLLHDPAVAGIVLNSRDITERRRAEEALRRSEERLRLAQKMEAVGRLAGGVAHDFNNLLTVVSGYGQLLLQRIGEDELSRRYIGGILGAADQAARLTDQLLTFSRRQVVKPRVLDLNAIVGETESLLRRLIGENIELVTRLDPELGRIEADPSQIEQVIMNLAVNARDAMPSGGRLVLETRNIELAEREPHWSDELPPGPYVLLTIADTGCGMDDETLSRIFEPFFTTKPEGKGSGLGLAMVFGIVKQSGGDILVRSAVGQGTVFQIVLPCVDAEPEVEVVAPAPADARPGSETVLIVEDRDDVRLLIREVLELNGYRVLEAASGEEAVRVIEGCRDPIDLLVTDVVLPQASGQELADRLTALRPNARVLFVSGYGPEEIVQQGLRLPAHFLQKPFTPQRLAQKAREVLDAPAGGAQ